MSREKVELVISSRTVLRVVGLIGVCLFAFYIFYLSRHVFSLVAAAIFLTIALDPLVELLRKKMPRALAVVLVSFGLFIIVGGTLGLFITPLIVNSEEIATSLVEIVTRIETSNFYERLDAELGLSNYFTIENGQLPAPFDNLPERTLDLLKGALASAFNFLVVFAMTAFLLYELPAITRFVMSLVKPDKTTRIEKLAETVSNAVAGYLLGNSIISIIAGIVLLIPLLLLDVPGALSLAAWMAIVDLIPVVGAAMGAVPALIAAFSVGTKEGIIVFMIIFIYQLIENHFLQPVIMKRTMSVSIVVVFLSVLIGIQLLGVIGALLAVPVAGTLQVLIVELAKARQEDESNPKTEGLATNTTSTIE